MRTRRITPSAETGVSSGGWIGLATAAAAWYLASGILLNLTFGREVIPLFAHRA